MFIELKMIFSMPGKLWIDRFGRDYLWNLNMRKCVNRITAVENARIIPNLLISSLILARCTTSSWSVCLNIVSTESKRTNSILAVRLPVARFVCIVDEPVLLVTAIVGAWNVGAPTIGLAGLRTISVADVSVRLTWPIMALLQRYSSPSDDAGGLKQSGLRWWLSSDMLESRWFWCAARRYKLCS